MSMSPLPIKKVLCMHADEAEPMRNDAIALGLLAERRLGLDNRTRYIQKQMLIAYG